MDHLDIPADRATHKINYSVPRIYHVTNSDFKFVESVDRSRLLLNAYGRQPLSLMLFYLHSLLVPNNQPLPYLGAHDWLHSTPTAKAWRRGHGPPPPPMREEEEAPVQPSLKDQLDCLDTSNRRPVDTPAVAIEVILSKPSHNFHTCCTMCIHMLQCNFPDVSFTPLHMLQCHFLHVSMTLFLYCAIIVYVYICCNFQCLTLHIYFIAVPSWRIPSSIGTT